MSVRGFQTIAAVGWLVLILAMWPLPSHAQESTWEVLSGTWTTGNGEGRGTAPLGTWGKILSQAWYGDFDLSGTLAGTGARSAAILIRAAGESENYQLILDWSRSTVTLRENHFGQLHDVVSASLRGLLRETATSFHITAQGNLFLAVLWSSGASESGGIRLEFGDMKIPEGPVGFAILDGELHYSGLKLTGETNSKFGTYAFHCDYRLAERVAKNPFWQYLDQVASSSHPRHFKTVQEFESYRTAAIRQLRRSLGLDPWPERNPLNARVVGSVDRGDFKIEKVIFESQPGFLVDALLYLPKKAYFPAPGILSTIGHYGDDDFFIWFEQGRCAGLAEKGYVVLTYDPIGQGERKWLGNGNHDTLRRKIILSGMEVSGLMFWDSIRAIDYLVSRPEVDPKRIGVTGVSGGGFNTLYTTLLDERVKAAGVDGYTTTIEALVKRGGAGCCGYLPNLSRYAEMQDVYSLMAPRRMLILGGYMDIISDRLLPIYESARSTYRLYGAEDNLQYFLDPDAGHTYSKPMRLAMYRWFNKWLKGIDDPAEAREPIDPEDALISRESGLLQVFAPGERGMDVIDLEREFLAKHQQRIPPPTSAVDVSAFQNRTRQRLIDLMGEKPPAAPPPVVYDDRTMGAGTVRHVTLKTERDLPVTVEIHHPTGTGKGVLLLYFSMSERYPTSELSDAEMVETLVRRGFTVAVPQVRGTGPTRVDDVASVELYSMALGKHLFSTRIYDLQRVIDFLEGQPQYKPLRLILWGEGPREGIMGLYLAAIDPRLQTVVSSHGLVSYQNIVDEDGLPDFDYYLPGILRYADVGDFIGAVAPRRVIISGAVDINNQLLSRDQTAATYAAARNIYRFLGREDSLVFASPPDLFDSLSNR
jgi:dienelactone hydrolase